MFWNKKKSEFDFEKFKVDIKSSDPLILKREFDKGKIKLGFPITYNPVQGFAKFKDGLFPGDSYLINMECRNGNFTLLNISTPDDFFEYELGIYILDDDAKYYMQSAKMWCLDYHQDFALPIKRKIHVNKILKDIKDTSVIDVEKATNPGLIKNFIDKQVIQQAIKGAGKLQEELNLLKILIIIVLIVSVIALIVLLKGSGMLNNIHIPGM